MRSREEHAPGGATLASPPITPTGREHNPVPRTHTNGVPRWDELLHRLTMEQQDHVLKLAQKQGLLYEQQIPVPESHHPRSRRSEILQLIQGKDASLPAFEFRQLEWIDSTLDEQQQQAVLRALSTPDIALIEGLPGGGKFRVLVEIVSQAVARGERVLFLSPEPATLDRLLAQLEESDTLCAVRCLGEEEALEMLPEETRALTFEERVKAFRQHVNKSTSENVAEHQGNLRRREDEQKAWSKLGNLVNYQHDLDTRNKELSKRRDKAQQQWDQEVELARQSKSDNKDLNDFQKKLAHLRKKNLSSLAKLERELKQAAARKEQAENELQQAKDEAQELQPLLQARESGRWWTGSFWKAKMQKDLSHQHEETITRLDEFQKAVDDQTETWQKITEQHKAKEEELREQEDSLIAEEEKQRQRELNREQTVLDQEAALIRRQWEEVLAQIQHEESRPTELTQESVDQARQRWQKHLDGEAERLRDYKCWARCLKDAVKAFPTRLARTANVVAITPSALPKHPQYGNKARPHVNFDLLLVEEAECLTEDEFLAAARRARRQVLVGTVEESFSRCDSTSVFSRLWKRLHPDPRQLSTRWVVEEDRLCCRLVPLEEDQTSEMEWESVADREDVEVGILIQEEPVIAEVRFPRGMSIREAKEYIFQELEVISAQCFDHSLDWHETDDAVRVWFHHVQGDTTPVSLEQGVLELVQERVIDDSLVQYDTVAFHFEKEHGWTREKAEDWIESSFELRDTQRTAYLQGLQQAPEEIRQYVMHLVEDDVPQKEDLPELSPWQGWTSSLGFADVPAWASGSRLELDLSRSEDFDRLPKELQSVLPRRGIVNVPEAQAVVQALEQLLSDENFRAEAGAWQENLPLERLKLAPKQRNSPVRLIGSPTIAITSISITQTQLIQHLLRQSRQLAGEKDSLFVAPSKPECSHRTDFFAILETPLGTLTVEVDVPRGLCRRESFLLMMSLTRSRADGNLTYGGGSPQLLMSISRAQGRALLFVDPETLQRRAEHSGKVETLDACESAIERRWVTLLHERVASEDARAFFALQPKQD